MSTDKSRKRRPPRQTDKSAHADPYRTRESAKYEQPIPSREFITSTLREQPGPMDFEALAEKLKLHGDDVAMEALRRRVGAMIRDGQLIQNRRRGLIPVDADNLLAGRISAHPDGFGFVIIEDSDKDIYLNGKQMRQVLHGDRVVVCVTGVDRRGRREGRIVDVVERANKSLVGRLSIDRGTVVVLPDNKRIHQDLLIAPGELGEAKDGDMVVAEIIEQPTRRHQPVGSIIEVLGQHLRPGMEIDVALHSHGIQASWPEEVLEQAASFSTTVDPATAKGRKDVRTLPLITIDGLDARDFDDAVWCEPLDKGWRLLVAIADVAHYVSPGSALDTEAVLRGTSVYFPGRVVPMLPEVLSNGLCSLNPEVDRLCMICELTLDLDGHVKKTRFHNGIMRSHARLTYDQVHEMLTEPTSDLRKQHAALLPMIEELHRLYEVLAGTRRQRGAIEFDSNETHIVFDDNKKIKEIVPVQRNEAHKLIEECMILANIQAAAFLQEKQIPALYRVHSGPKADRLEDLRAFLSLRSLGLGGGDSPTAQDYAALAESIVDRPDRSVIQTVMLRSMQQAVYQPKNEGHFGLALEEYAHFTSPIRRYPDLLVHRALKFAIARGKPVDYRYSKEAMTGLGESCSMTERRAEDASRDVVSWLKCEYMQEHVGSEFDGVITAVTAFGLFVELSGIHVEGLIHVTNLSRDYYRYDQAAQAMIGERTGRQYRLGEPIKISVSAVNLEDRKIDFSEVEQAGSALNEHKGAGREGSDRKRRRSKSGASQQPPQRAPKPVPRPVHAQAAKADAAKPSANDISAEQRRQQKRKLKQKRRDQKRADRRAQPLVDAAKAGAPVEVGDDGKVMTGDAAVRVNASGKAAARKPRTAKGSSGKKVSSKATAKAPVTATGITTEASRSESGKSTSRKKVTSKQETAANTSKKKAAGTGTGTTANVITSKIASKKKSASRTVTSTPAASKTDSKKRAASKAVANKTVSKKRAANKAVASKTVSKKKAASKTTLSKTEASKTVSKKTSASGTTANRRGVGKKVPSKKTVSKKATATTTHSAAVNGKKTSRSQPITKKTASKIAGKKISGKKTVGKKIAGKKIAGKKTAGKKIAGKKIAGKKTAGKKIAGKKVAGKKAGSKKVSAGKKFTGRKSP